MSKNLQELVDQLMSAAAALDPGENGGTAVTDMDEMTRGLRLGSLHSARNQLAEFLAKIPRTHVVALDEDGWVLEHPLSCRRDDEVNLTWCPFNDALMSPPGVDPGRYEVRLVDGELIVGDAI